MKVEKKLPIAIIGAGPIGLAAAAHLSERKLAFLVFESGSRIADNVRSWQHVSMFSPWAFNLDKAALKILSKYDWKKPDADALPTGKELIESYLGPLAKTRELKPFIHFNNKVVSISRKRIDKMKNFRRETAPFVLYVKDKDELKRIEARAVIDASGTWKSPNPLGADGLPARGEHKCRDQIFYGIPDVLGEERDRFKNKKVAVVGGGHSAINTLLNLAELSKKYPSTELTWILRKAKIEDAYGGLDQDELPGRGKIGVRIKELVESAKVNLLTPFFIEKIMNIEGQLIVVGETPEGTKAAEAEEIICATGLRPDLNMLRELRVDLDVAVESPVQLAPLIDPNIHSCGSVPPHGEKELRHPEKDFYIVGMKSYGRAPTFLLATGYEQVRSVTAWLAGDYKAAEETWLKLPETGVCGVPASRDPNSVKVRKQPSCC